MNTEPKEGSIADWKREMRFRNRTDSILEAAAGALFIAIIAALAILACAALD